MKIYEVNEKGEILAEHKSMTTAAEAAGVALCTLSNAFRKYHTAGYFARCGGRLWDKDDRKQDEILCPTCGLYLMPHAFYPDPGRSTGRSWCCRECEKERQRKYKEKRMVG